MFDLCLVLIVLIFCKISNDDIRSSTVMDVSGGSSPSVSFDEEIEFPDRLADKVLFFDSSRYLLVVLMLSIFGYFTPAEKYRLQDCPAQEQERDHRAGWKLCTITFMFTYIHAHLTYACSNSENKLVKEPLGKYSKA